MFTFARQLRKHRMAAESAGQKGYSFGRTFKVSS